MNPCFLVFKKGLILSLFLPHPFEDNLSKCFCNVKSAVEVRGALLRTALQSVPNKLQPLIKLFPWLPPISLRAWPLSSPALNKAPRRGGDKQQRQAGRGQRPGPDTRHMV